MKDGVNHKESALWQKAASIDRSASVMHVWHCVNWES